MKFRIRVSVVLLAGILVSVNAQSRQSNGYKNLQVLDKDIASERLNSAMVKNVRGLGLTLRNREGCLFCHIGSLDKPVREWDFASDEKQTKQKARVMMQMVADINENYLSQLEGRIDTQFEVTCATCHAGRTDPRPLQTVLIQDYLSHGISSVLTTYDDFRNRHYGNGTYDFRPFVLEQVARIAARNKNWDDAITLEKKNEDVHPTDVSVSQARLAMQIAKLLDTESIEAGLNFYDLSIERENPGVAGPAVLNGLGRLMTRMRRTDAALEILNRNVELYPTKYLPVESLSDTLWTLGKRNDSIAVLDGWIKKNPDHERGSIKLIERRDQLERSR